MLVVEELLCFLDQEDMELMADVASLLWLRCNASVFGRLVSPIRTVVTLAFETLMAFCQARSHPTSAPVATQSMDLRWKAPPTGFVKSIEMQ